MEESMVRIKDHLEFLYGQGKGEETFSRLKNLMDGYKKKLVRPKDIPEAPLPLDERDAIVITYGDQFQRDGESSLKTLENFFTTRIRDAVSGMHILPFAPYSSDDGFSVIDYRKVNPDFGSWEDIRKIARRYRLMVDLVLNHISAKSEWFQEFLKGNEKYREYFIVVPDNADLSKVVRPRALPLLTEFDTWEGKKKLWTTFSADQIDLNYKNPDLLLEIIDIMLFYAEMGAQIIRLDAIAYLWKEFGTTCIHLEQTHRVVKLFRAVLEEVAPWVIIITETNVPHKENISYFGNGYDEAQMVYQFSLPPLVLDAFRRGSANHLRDWASTLTGIEGDVTFFNFLASHDGVGLLPAHGILTEEELNDLVELSLSHGGLVSYKATPEGDIPYELNITYFDAIVSENDSDDVKVKKFLSSQSIMLELKGVPGIYIHSLLGTRNYSEGVKITGVNRTINRKKFRMEELEKEMADETSLVRRVFDGYIKMLNVRRKEKVFNPLSSQRILTTEGAVFGLLRYVDLKDGVICLNNTSPNRLDVKLSLSELGLENVSDGITLNFKDLLSQRNYPLSVVDGSLSVELGGYDTLWLKRVFS